MRFWNFSTKASLAALAAVGAWAQAPGVLSVQEPPKLVVGRGEEARLVLKASVRPGYHANSSTPAEEYLIPLRLTWDPHGPLQAAEIIYPKPKYEKYEFTDKPISVVDGEFEIVTRFRRAPNAQPGPGYVSGKLRYQACNEKMCLPPKTVDVKAAVLLQ